MVNDKKQISHKQDLEFRMFLITEPKLHNNILDMVINWLRNNVEITLIYTPEELIEAVNELAEAQYKKALKG